MIVNTDRVSCVLTDPRAPSLWLGVRICTLPGRRVASELLSRSEAPPSALPDPSVNCNAVIMTAGWWSKGLGLF